MTGLFFVYYAIGSASLRPRWVCLIDRSYAPAFDGIIELDGTGVVLACIHRLELTCRNSCLSRLVSDPADDRVVGSHRTGMKVADADIDEIRASNGVELIYPIGRNIVEKAWVAPALHAPHGGDAAITALEGRNLREGVHRGQIASPS